MNAASLLRPPRYSPHTSVSRPRTCAQGRFRGVDVRTCSPAVQHPNHVASTADVLRRRFLGRTPGEEGRNDGMWECWNTGMLGMGHPDSLIVPPFHDSTIPVFPFRPIGGFPRRRGGRLYGRSPIQGFAFLVPASSACARSVLIPGTCDLTPKRTAASDSAAHYAWTGPDHSRTLNRPCSSPSAGCSYPRSSAFIHG